MSNNNSNNNSSISHAIITTAAAVAAVTAISLSLLQTDFAGRILLNAKKLQFKRVKEYLHRWDWTLKKAVLYARKGHDQQMDKSKTLVVFTEDDIKSFLQDTLLLENVSILSIEVDDYDFNYYLYFENVTNGYLYQVPLVNFGLALSQVMEEQLTSTALCFIADASSGLSGHVLSTILSESKAGVAVIDEPLWMALFANLVEKDMIPTAKMERILFGLCRLDAWRVRNQVGSARTVAFVLPGQACTPVLLPLLQSIFPCERHLFAYDGCISSVQRALYWRQNNNNNNTTNTTTFHNVITATTPMSHTSLTASIRTLAQALAKLPLHLADTTETWMTSVHVFLQMKEEERTNDYLPYVLKLSFIVNDESLDSNDSLRKLALTNVLQFITGSRSRPISTPVLDAAVESLRDVCGNLPKLAPLSLKQCAAIENAVFQHKSILIENKTLLDTVMPQKEWTLKAAKKISGCACCAPDEEDVEEESNVAKQERASRQRPKYVDGKMGFAFDPTQFG